MIRVFVKSHNTRPRWWCGCQQQQRTFRSPASSLSSSFRLISTTIDTTYANCYGSGGNDDDNLTIRTASTYGSPDDIAKKANSIHLFSLLPQSSASKSSALWCSLLLSHFNGLFFRSRDDNMNCMSHVNVYNTRNYPMMKSIVSLSWIDYFSSSRTISTPSSITSWSYMRNSIAVGAWMILWKDMTMLPIKTATNNPNSFIDIVVDDMDDDTCDNHDDIWLMSSTLKKRRSKMNKHKLRKRRKLARRKNKK